MSRYYKIERILKEIEVHQALQTPHTWVNIPGVQLPHPLLARTTKPYDVRICSLCFHGEKCVGKSDNQWRELEGVNTYEILHTYLRYKKKVPV